MIFKFLGTAAAEGIPAVFCECEACTIARKRGGKHIRTRSQAIINDDFLIDLNADTYIHFLNNNIVGSKIKNCIVTHNHSDHFYPAELVMRLPSFGTKKTVKKLNIYGSETVGKAMSAELFRDRNYNTIGFTAVSPAVSFETDGYKITPLKAIHDIASGPLIYLIERNGKTIFYGNDTNFFDESVWEYLKENKIHLDLVTLDCTEADVPVMSYIGHMNLNDNVKIKERLIELGCADEKTIFVCNHFSHNGKDVSYDEFKKIAEEKGFLVSYDGMTIEL